MTITLTYPPAPAPPLACDCVGAVAYIKLKADSRPVTRDGHGVLRGTLVSRSQSVDGSWTYTFSVDESGLTFPPQAVSSSMVETVCCQGCLGYAAESFNQNSFGERLVAKTDPLTTNLMLPVRHLIRAFHVEDLKAWVDTPGATPVTLNLFAGGQKSAAPLTIPAGAYMSDRTFSFVEGRSCRLPEDILVEIKVVNGGGAKGLEVRAWGHENPSAYLSPVVAPGSGGVNMVGDYTTLLDPSTPIGSEFHSFPYIFKKTTWGISRITVDTEFTPPG